MPDPPNSMAKPAMSVQSAPALPREQGLAGWLCATAIAICIFLQLWPSVGEAPCQRRERITPADRSIGVFQTFYTTLAVRDLLDVRRPNWRSCGRPAQCTGASSTHALRPLSSTGRLFVRARPLHSHSGYQVPSSDLPRAGLLISHRLRSRLLHLLHVRRPVVCSQI
jgi:hypothetical protein